MPIISIEGLKDRAALLRVLINGYIKGLGAKHLLHTTQNAK